MEKLSIHDKCITKGLSWAIMGFFIIFVLVFIGWASFGLIIISVADFKTVDQVVLFNNIMNDTLLIALLNASYLATIISTGLFCFGYIKEWTVIKLFPAIDA